MKKLVLIFGYTIFLIHDGFTQYENYPLQIIQLEVNRNIINGTENRIAFIFQGYTEQYNLSMDNYETAKSLINYIYKTYLDSIDTNYYNSSIENIEKEITITMEEIEMKAFGPTMKMEWNNKWFNLTSEQVSYITYLTLLKFKAQDKLKDLNKK